MSSTGPATVGGRAATVSDDNVTKYTGNVSGGLRGRNIDITFTGDNNAGVVHFTGTVGDDGTVHNGVMTGPTVTHSWDSINGPLGCTDAPPPAAPPPPAPAQQPAPPDAQTTAARLGVAANGPTTLSAGVSGTYTVNVSNSGDVSAPVELFISFNGQLAQTGFTPSGGFNCDVRNYAGGSSSVHCTAGQFQSKGTASITVQGRGSAPGAGQLVVNINSSDPGAQFVQKSQQLNVTIT